MRDESMTIQSNDRAEQFKAEIAEMKVKTGRGKSDNLLQLLGVVLMVGGNIPGVTRTVAIDIFDRVQASDYAAANAQFKFAALRYFNASGCAMDGTIGEDHDPETHLIPVILQAILGLRPEITVFGTDYPTKDGTNVRDYIHVDDLADAHILAMQKVDTSSPIFANLGTGAGFSVKEIIATAEKVTGKKVPVKWGPRRAGDAIALYADPSYAKKTIGWEAKYKDPETIIRSAWNWFEKNPKGYQK